MKEEAIDSAIDACYDAVLDQQRWPGALHALAGSIDAASCMFYPESPDGTVLRLPASPVFSQFLEAFVGEGWWLDDHRADRAFPLFHAGRTVLIEHDIATEDDRRAIPAYHELYFRHGLPWWAGFGFRVAGRQWCMPILRSGSQGAFTQEEAHRMERIVPHLRRMVSVSEKLTLGRIASALDVLDCIRAPALALDWRGRAIRMNRHAERVVGDGISLAAGGQLVAADPEGNLRLQRLICAVMAPEATEPASRPAAISAIPVTLNRRNRRPLIIEAMPASGLFADMLHQARALVFITDPESVAQPAPERLAAILGITPAEARLMARLASGDDLAGVAAGLGISIHTARSQIKSLFAKTDTRRQAELVTLAGRIAAPPERK